MMSFVMPSVIYQVGPHEVLSRARALRRELGVRAVTVDPIRGQLVVRYAPEQTSDAELRLSLHAAPRDAGAPECLLFLWPHLLRLSRMASALA
jgi:hypothetical protein